MDRRIKVLDTRGQERTVVITDPQQIMNATTAHLQVNPYKGMYLEDTGQTVSGWSSGFMIAATGELLKRV